MIIPCLRLFLFSLPFLPSFPFDSREHSKKARMLRKYFTDCMKAGEAYDDRLGCDLHPTEMPVDVWLEETHNVGMSAMELVGLAPRSAVV
jgi:hypothetical protein